MIAKSAIGSRSPSVSAVDPNDIVRIETSRPGWSSACFETRAKADRQRVTDVELTEQLLQAGRLMGVDVVDHIIVGDGSFVSLALRGLRAPCASRNLRECR